MEVEALEIDWGGAKVEQDVCEEVLGLEELEGTCEVETMSLEVEEELDPEALRQQRGSWRSRAIVYTCRSRFSILISFSKAELERSSLWSSS